MLVRARWLGLLVGLHAVGLAGCGRLAFDEHPGGVTTDAGPDGSGTADFVFRDLCRFDRITIVENGISIDDDAGAAVAAAVAAGCGTTPTTRAVQQDDPGILDPVTDRPLLPADELVILGGGDGPHRAVAYLLQHDTPVTWSGASTATFQVRATGQTIVMGPTSSSHDYALVMIVTEPIAGTRFVSVSGMQANGTAAAAWWFVNRVAPTIAAQADAWMLVEWTDGDADPKPTAGDTYAVLGSG